MEHVSRVCGRPLGSSLCRAPKQSLIIDATSCLALRECQDQASTPSLEKSPGVHAGSVRVSCGSRVCGSRSSIQHRSPQFPSRFSSLLAAAVVTEDVPPVLNEEVLSVEMLAETGALESLFQKQAQLLDGPSMNSLALSEAPSCVGPGHPTGTLTSSLLPFDDLVASSKEAHGMQPAYNAVPRFELHGEPLEAEACRLTRSQGDHLCGSTRWSLPLPGRVDAPPLSLFEAPPSGVLETPSLGVLETPSLGVFEAVLQSEPPPSTEKKAELGSDYHVNVGYAIRTLREELPTMFYKEMTYDIYRDDITFQDPLNAFHGMKSYKTIFWALRFHGRIFFKALWVDVNRVWQPNERTIIIRWTVRGVPRVPWEAWGRFDGTSEYKLDKDGKIYAHKVDNVALSDPPKYRALSVVELLQLAGVQQNPGMTCFSSFAGRARGLCDGAVRGVKGASVSRAVMGPQHGRGSRAGQLCSGPGVGSFSWFRFYLALTGTLALQDDLEFAAKALLLA